MKTVFISLTLGSAAGILDIIPMLIRKLDPLFILSAFSMWMVTGLLIPRVGWTSHAWLNGILMASLVFLPQFFLILRLDRAALPQILGIVILLGAGLGVVSGRLL